LGGGGGGSFGESFACALLAFSPACAPFFFGGGSFGGGGGGGFFFFGGGGGGGGRSPFDLRPALLPPLLFLPVPIDANYESKEISGSPDALSQKFCNSPTLDGADMDNISASRSKHITGLRRKTMPMVLVDYSRRKVECAFTRTSQKGRCRASRSISV
jgi:hypothetical protein